MRSKRKLPPMPGDDGERGIPDGPDPEEPVDEVKRGGRPKKKTGGHAEGHLEGHRADRRPRRAGGGHLSAASRRKLPTSDFALPGKGAGPEGKGSGSYPIPDEGHAKSALGRAEHNATPAEQATIRRAVHRKFPGMERAGRSSLHVETGEP